MEYAKGISLREYYRNTKEHRISEPVCKKVFYQLAEAMSYLHSNHIAHRDIKLENIIIDKNYNVKLFDFGFGVYNPHDELQTFFCGTPNYMPPEIFQKIKYKPELADLWSLGVLLYKMIAGEFPYKGKDEKELFKHVKDGIYSFPSFVSEQAKMIIKSLIVKNPEERIKMDKILCFAWFNSLKNKKVGNEESTGLEDKKSDLEDKKTDVDYKKTEEDKKNEEINN